MAARAALKSAQSAHGRLKLYAEQVSSERARTIESRAKALASELEAEEGETPCRAVLKGFKGEKTARAAGRAASAAYAGRAPKAEGGLRDRTSCIEGASPAESC